MHVETTSRAAARRKAGPSAYQLSTIGKADIGRLQRYFARLSATSRQQRFHGAAVDTSILERVMDRAACAIIVENGSEDQPVGEAVLVMEPDSPSAEIALSTADGWQRRGIGKALLSYLERKAAAANARNIYGDTQSSNKGMLALARRCGYRIVRTPGDWTLTRFEKSLAPAVT